MTYFHRCDVSVLYESFFFYSLRILWRLVFCEQATYATLKQCGFLRSQLLIFFVFSNFVILSHICRMDLSILIIWMSPFRILGVSDILFHCFAFNPYKHSVPFLGHRQTVKTQIKCRVRVCTVCLCPKNGTLCLYGLKAKLVQNRREKLLAY